MGYLTVGAECTREMRVLPNLLHTLDGALRTVLLYGASGPRVTKRERNRLSDTNTIHPLKPNETSGGGFWIYF